MEPFILFLTGLALLLFGSRGVVNNALIIAKLTKIPPLVIGITVVAIGTSLPEIVVSFFGGIEHAPGLALGNIIGSSIANIGLIFGLALLLHPVYIGQTKTQRNMWVCLVVSLLLFVLLMIDGINIGHSLFFLLAGFLVIIWQVKQGKESILTEEIEAPPSKNHVITISVLLGSLVGLFLGGKLLVDSGVAIAKFFGVPDEIIGIVAVSVGTSLPELAVSVLALSNHITKDKEKLVVGNILGSNIFNVLFGAGILGTFGVSYFQNQYTLFAFMFFTIAFSFLILYFKAREIPRYVGLLLLLGYFTYLFFLFLEL